MDVATRPAKPAHRREGFSPKLLRQLSASLDQLRSGLIVNGEVLDSLGGALQREVTPAEAADAIAQAVVCGAAIAKRFPDRWQECHVFLGEQCAPWEQAILDRIDAAGGTESNASFGELTHLYEHLLRHDQPDRRKRSGVFFTPQPIVRYMLRRIDAQLREEFRLAYGLADETTWGTLRQRQPAVRLPRGARDVEPVVRLFDPAVGTGTFLLEAIDFTHDALIEQWRSEGLGDDEIADRWNDYVPRSLLPRLWGMELLAAAAFLAKLHVALKLAQTGYRFAEHARIEIHLGNTLAGPAAPLFVRRESVARRGAAAYDVPFTVVLGNPPFSYLSENQSEWIAALVRGESGHAGYFEADGERLAEKKTWLHDDYVKFLRYSQWRIETTGCGIVALVTNHGYLTNATFRILRQQLLKAFPRITLLDLHGNRKARENAPGVSRDENVFGLDQGIAIGFFRRPPEDVAPRVEHAELWGSRKEKFERLDSGQVGNLPHAPVAPEFRFVREGEAIPPEYAAAPSLTDLLPRHATAPVTARDHFVVAFTRRELIERIEALCDLSIPDDEIRRRYFTRTRSPRYAPGDTRGWKLGEARRIIAAERDWQSFLQPCQYRPLDWRWIFWHPSMIDWPREEVTRCFVAQASPSPPLPLSHSPPPPLAIIARRQLPPTEPCTYFWATSALALDGIIRNDNRGSESLFPIAAGQSDETACYAYALFHSATYRQRYAAALRRGFPRVAMPREEELTTTLAQLGRELIALHTRRPPPDANSQRLLVTVAPRFPHFAEGRIWIRDDYTIAAADEPTWLFRVGAHQVARKWLASRRGRPLTDADLAWYDVILDTISQTRTLMAAVDAAIEGRGGFPAAFRRS